MQRKDTTKQEHITLLKPKAGPGKGPNVPDFLMVEPDEDTKKLQMHKQQLLEAVKPTEKSISAVRIFISSCAYGTAISMAQVGAQSRRSLQVMKTPELAQGFDDPEIMKAVEEIGKNPKLIQTKYANNAKVAQFYRAMAGHVGQQLSALGGAEKTVS